MPSGELNLKIEAGSEPFGISQAQNFRAGIEAGISCLNALMAWDAAPGAARLGERRPMPHDPIAARSLFTP